jgi:predicted flavoprotein YhiN
VVAERFGEGEIWLEADLSPDETFEVLTERLQRFVRTSPRKKLESFVEEFVAARLAPAVLFAAGLEPDVIGQGVQKKALNRLVSALKGWSLGRVRHVPLEKGEVVAGGVSLDEVDPRTMRSLKCEGLFLCGEVLDIAGPVGGYNLQAAFATGYVAGETSASI